MPTFLELTSPIYNLLNDAHAHFGIAHTSLCITSLVYVDAIMKHTSLLIN